MSSPFKFTIILLFALATGVAAQSPHGEAMRMDCASCHTPDGWEISRQKWAEYQLVDPTRTPPGPDTTKFSHDRQTTFPLTGSHIQADCRSCHASMVFEQASSDCISCHTDLHQTTVGNDCARCHHTDNWQVNDIFGLHQQNGFPLTGAHARANCNECHKSESVLRFDRLGNACINCHAEDYNGTTNPNHAQAGFSTNCAECHDMSADGWDTESIRHDFFPLTKGHDIQDCASCHTTGDYTSTPTDCFACHQTDYEGTANPDHELLHFSNQCATCHTTDPDWMPANFEQHDMLFPIYSGEHKGEWSQCTDCHKDPANYANFTCISCHTNPDTDEEHDGVNGYQYNDPACLACHPTGSADNVFDHSTTNFALTGAHQTVNCQECHANGYAGTPTQCASCHTDNYNATSNPNHTTLGLTTDCATCHTTNGWEPASFPNHNDFYPLNGAHAAISNNCADCHNGDYNNTPNTCAGCHTEDYNNTSNPDHEAAHFPTDCTQCHTESAWEPATFDHDAQHFPIYSGEHQGEWSQCTDCHTNPANYAEYTCTSCHTNPETDNQHGGVGGYTYNDAACLACHPTGSADNVFDHNTTGFALTGAHTTTSCLECHSNGFQGTPTQCASCHNADYIGSSNPGHLVLNLPTDCATCHTTAAWAPASFAIHNDFYVLNGAHAAIAGDCVSCHNGNYNTTPNTCAGCHSADYNQAQSPNHAQEQFPTDCASCHTETAWAPSTFDHNTHYPLTGAHAGIAADCSSCHNGDYVNTPNTCAGCHTDNYNQTANPNHIALNITTDCATCHTNTAWEPAAFPNHNSYYPLNGAHAGIANDCAQCHNGDYNNTPNTCAGCHTDDYNNTTNPNHISAQFPTNCASCHSETAWTPTSFNHDAQYFPIYSGDHEGEWNQCTDCHTNPANYAEVTCINCHTNPDTDEEHQGVNGYSYNSTACLACHPTGDASNVFDHSLTSFPLTGAHQTAQCMECHNTGFQGTSTACASCHNDQYVQAANPSHLNLNISTDCASCHTTTAWEPATFAIHDNFFVLTGAHLNIATDCAACHHGDYNNTANTCNGCHSDDYAQSQNPDHTQLNLPVSCENCHTTNAGWSPATFAIHDDFYPLVGAHAAIANDCNQCHTGGNFTNTPNTCAGCHTDEFNQTVSPNHVQQQFPTDCAACHSQTVWTPSTFDHSFYPIEGAHTSLTCNECHQGNYTNPTATCVTCHNDDYGQTTNPDHTAQSFSTDCANCHGQTAWAPSNFSHNNWPLTGAHMSVTCNECHQGNYNNTPNTCAGCHTDDYTQSINPGHVSLNLPATCETCHTTNAGWAPATFPIHDNFYQLIGAHAAIANDCAACHNGDYNNTPNTCSGCHTDEFNATTDPNHVAQQFPANCTECHSQTAWTPSTLDHSFYPIIGAHTSVSCNDCHQGNYTNPPNTCAGCHTDDFNTTTDPNHVAQQFPTSCTDCHDQNAWVPSTFNHSSVWPLTGAHATAACNDCHQGNYTNTPNTCAGCHTSDYNQSINPNHLALNIPTTCETCHTTEPGWAPATFPIHDNYYQLIGAHAAISNDCAACHNGDYNNTPNTCAGCHTDDYNNTTNPDHEAQQFPLTCEECHGQTAWIPSTFSHSNWPLTGAHLTTSCNDCHQGNYNNTPNTCTACHQADYNQSINPNHVSLNLPVTCETCHTTDPGWAPATFPIHDNFYQLIGAHAAIANDCAACHNGDYNNTPNTCNGCHNDDYTQTTNPDHVAQQFPTNCTECHNQTAWIPSTLDHSFYPIVGAHTSVSCNDCHQGNYNNPPTTCAGCHTDDYNQTVNPNHLQQQFPTSCVDCHDQNAWVPSTFNHGSVWPLTGEHTTVDCNACHQGNYNNLPNTCVSCHQADYNQSINPNHVSLSIPTSCDMCHTTDPDWMPATFPIHNDYYPLLGAHANIANDCAACHNGNYNNTPNTCVGCHQDDYNATTNPDHETAGFPTDCTICHNETAWIPSTFDHSSVWPLNGAHTSVSCAACHGNFSNNPPTTCVGCHQSDYNTSNDPPHQSMGFPTTCADCHNETAWVPSTFDHDGMYFPIFSGKHKDEWDQCVDCHTGGNYASFSCLGCHTNPQTNNDHQGVSGYQYESNACYSCHPDGED
jgi:hypothetical protein